MYCSNCGKAGEGNFCTHCGTALNGGNAPVVLELGDWGDEIRYDLLLQQPEVRDMLARNAAQAQKKMTGEQFLGICEKLMCDGVPLGKIATVAQPIYSKLGINTGKTRREIVSVPPGRALVGVLCSLAKRGQELRKVDQAQDGCLVEAEIPSDLWSFAGDLLITVQRQGQQTSIEAVTQIKGQMFDWGKSNRCLDTLFQDVRELSAA